MVQNNILSIQKLTFIYELKIRGPKWRNISTASNEGDLYNIENIQWKLKSCFLLQNKLTHDGAMPKS